MFNRALIDLCDLLRDPFGCAMRLHIDTRIDRCRVATRLRDARAKVQKPIEVRVARTGSQIELAAD